MKNNKKDRKVMTNQIICSQHALALKYRSMRVGKLELLLKYVEEGAMHNEVLNELTTFIKHDLKPIDLCDTSSDEEVSILQIPQNTNQVSNNEVKNKLPGLMEK